MGYRVSSKGFRFATVFCLLTVFTFSSGQAGCGGITTPPHIQILNVYNFEYEPHSPRTYHRFQPYDRSQAALDIPIEPPVSSSVANSRNGFPSPLPRHTGGHPTWIRAFTPPQITLVKVSITPDPAAENPHDLSNASRPNTQPAPVIRYILYATGSVPAVFAFGENAATTLPVNFQESRDLELPGFTDEQGTRIQNYCYYPEGPGSRTCECYVQWNYRGGISIEIPPRAHSNDSEPAPTHVTVSANVVTRIHETFLELPLHPTETYGGCSLLQSHAELVAPGTQYTNETLSLSYRRLDSTAMPPNISDNISSSVSVENFNIWVSILRQDMLTSLGIAP